MKRNTVLKLWKVFIDLEKSKYDVRFSYFLAKNKIALKGEVDALNNAQMADQSFIDFENERIRLAQELSDKDEAGNPKVFNGQYIINDKKDEFATAMSQVRIKFESAIKNRETQIEDYNRMLNEDADITLSKIKFNQLPKQIESSVLEIFIEADILEEDE